MFNSETIICNKSANVLNFVLLDIVWLFFPVDQQFLKALNFSCIFNQGNTVHIFAFIISFMTCLQELSFERLEEEMKARKMASWKNMVWQIFSQDEDGGCWEGSQIITLLDSARWLFSLHQSSDYVISHLLKPSFNVVISFLLFLLPL